MTGTKRRKQQFVGTFLDIYLKHSLEEEVVIIFVEGGFICSCLLGNVCLRFRNSSTSYLLTLCITLPKPVILKICYEANTILKKAIPILFFF